MTKVDFYSLANRDDIARLRFACRLSRRALDGGFSVHIRTTDLEASAEMDQTMWDYPLGRFLPHAVAGTPEADCSRVTIGHEAVDPPDQSFLINLTAAVPEDWDRFERVAEIVIAPLKSEGRDRYRQYRELVCQLEHHDPFEWEPQT